MKNWWIVPRQKYDRLLTQQHTVWCQSKHRYLKAIELYRKWCEKKKGEKYQFRKCTFSIFWRTIQTKEAVRFVGNVQYCYDFPVG